MRLQRLRRFVRRAIVHSRPVPYSIFQAGERPIEARTAAPPAADGHRVDVRGGRDLFMPRRHWKISAAIYGSIAGRVGSLLRRLPAGTHLSKSGHHTEIAGDDATLHAAWAVDTAARVYCIEFFRTALSSAGRGTRYSIFDPVPGCLALRA